MTKIVIFNLTQNVKREHVEEIFTTFGKVKDTFMPTRSNGIHKGVAFVTFEKHEESEEAIKKMNNGQIDGVLVRVQVSDRPAKEQTYTKDINNDGGVGGGGGAGCGIRVYARDDFKRMDRFDKGGDDRVGSRRRIGRSRSRARNGWGNERRERERERSGGRRREYSPVVYGGRYSRNNVNRSNVRYDSRSRSRSRSQRRMRHRRLPSYSPPRHYSSRRFERRDNEREERYQRSRSPPLRRREGRSPSPVPAAPPRHRGSRRERSVSSDADSSFYSSRSRSRSRDDKRGIRRRF